MLFVTKRMPKLPLIALALLLVASITATANDISYFTTVTNTDYLSAGVGDMRTVSAGTINLSGLSGTVTKAYIYWNGPTNSTDPAANASVKVNGVSVVGTNIGFSDDNCWGFVNSQGYRADITALVAAAGNGDYALSNFGSSYFGIETNGASIIVFYDDGDATNNRDVVLFDGNDSNIPNAFDADGWNVSLSNINYSGGDARIQLHVSDGQFAPDEELFLNSTSFVPAGPIFSGGSTGPLASSGSLWDVQTFDATSFFNLGLNNLSLTCGVGIYDCLSLVVAAIDLPAGAAPPPPPNPIPEPATMALLGTGLAGLGMKLRRRRRANKREDI